jgi:hypothetical protein
MAWDADNLYLCSESQRLPNETLICRYRDQTMGGNTVMDDSIEVHFSPVGRNVVGKNLPWAAQAILNPLGVGFYSKFTWAVASRTTAWSPEWKTGSQIHENSWVIEIVIPNKSLDLQNPNKAGEPWSILLARNWKRTGWNQSAIPAHLTSFQVPQEQPFGYLTEGAFARLEDVSKLFDGDIHAAVQVGTCGDKAEKASIQLVIESLNTAKTPEAEPLKYEKKDEIEAVPDRLTPWSVHEAGKLRERDYRCYLKVSSATSQKPLLEVNFFFRPGTHASLKDQAGKMELVEHEFRAQLAPTRDVLEAFADFLNSRRKEQIAKLAIEVRMEGGEKPLFAGESRNIHYESITDTFQLPALEAGKYEWKMALLDRGNQKVAEQTGGFEKKEPSKAFPWWDFKGARVDKVLWPYEAIQVENGGARLKYWGGEYQLDGLCLPRQVQVTANQEWRPALLEERPSVLARGIGIRATQEGKPADVAMQGFPRAIEATDWAAKLRGYGQIGKTVEVQADAEFGQDGLLWVRLTLRPARDASSGRDVRLKEAMLDSLVIDIPYREQAARSVVAHGAPGYGSFAIGPVPAGEGVVWDCTQIGRTVLTYGDLLPVVWLGNDQRGLCIFAENNQGWLHQDRPDQQIVRSRGEVVLRLNVIQAPATLKGDRQFSFGLMPTPMRKMTPGWRMLNCSFSQDFADSFYTGRTASRDQYYNASFTPESYEKSRQVMFRNTESMTTTLGGFEFAPHTERGGYETVSRDWPAKGYFGPEWSQNTWTPAFQDHLLWQLQNWIEEGGLTGIYHDQFCPEAVTNTIAGAAYVLPDGRTNRGYNMRLDRLYNTREHALFLENGIQPRIFCHTTNGGQLISYPWVTAALDGEANMVIANADYDFVDIYPPERMQAYGNPWNWGNTFYWMRLIQKGDDKWQARQDRAYQGWTILHDVMYANGAEGHRQPFFDWGMNDRRVKYWPYWRNQEVVLASDPRVLVSMWILQDRALLCALNRDKREAVQASIRLPLADLGLMPKVRSEYIRGYDMEGGKAAFRAWEGVFDVSIPPHDFRLLVVRKYED